VLSVGEPSVPNGQCVICYKTFSSSSLAPAKLLRHLQTNHSENKDNLIEIISVFNQLDAQNLFHNKFYFMPLHVSSTCAHQAV